MDRLPSFLHSFFPSLNIKWAHEAKSCVKKSVCKSERVQVSCVFEWSPRSRNRSQMHKQFQYDSISLDSKAMIRAWLRVFTEEDTCKLWRPRHLRERTFQEKHREVQESYMFGMAAAKTMVQVGTWEQRRAGPQWQGVRLWMSQSFYCRVFVSHSKDFNPSCRNGETRERHLYDPS